MGADPAQRPVFSIDRYATGDRTSLFAGPHEALCCAVMVARILYLVFGSGLIILTVDDALFTENNAREQHANLVGVLGGIGLMIAATAFRESRSAQSAPVAPPPSYPQMMPPQAPPTAPGYGQQHPQGQPRY